VLNISQDKVAKSSRCDRVFDEEYYCKFIAKSCGDRLWKSLSIWQNYAQQYGVAPFDQQMANSLAFEPPCGIGQSSKQSKMFKMHFKTHV